MAKNPNKKMDARRFGSIHDTILCSAAGNSPTWNTVYTPPRPDLAGMKKTEVDALRKKSARTDPGWIDRLLPKDEAAFTTEPPERTDEGKETTPGLRDRVPTQRPASLVAQGDAADAI